MNAVPAYESMLTHYHRAFQKELERMLEELPICAGDRVLDVGCGSGFYSAGFAPLVAPLGEVIGIDRLPAYLQLARKRARQSLYPKLIHFQKANIQKLPYDSEHFDLVWCAQSLYSLPDPAQALREMTRVVKHGGAVAVLEDDTLHQLLLPWSLDDELLLRRAEWRAFQKDKGQSAERFYIARHLRGLFVEAGLKPQRRRTYASHREYPVGLEERHYLDAYLTDLKNRTAPFLSKGDRKRMHGLLTPGSTTYLVDQPHFSLTCLDHVLWGKKP